MKWQLITMESKSLRHTETYHSGKFWHSQIRIRYLSVHHKTTENTHENTQILSYHSWKLCEHYEDHRLIFIMSGNSCLEHSSSISPRTLQFTLGPFIVICNNCFSDNFAKDADKVVWRFVAFGWFRNFESEYLVRTCLSL